MKIAVLLPGQVRFIEKSYKYFKKNILQPMERLNITVDIFISTDNINNNKILKDSKELFDRCKKVYNEKLKDFMMEIKDENFLRSRHDVDKKLGLINVEGKPNTSFYSGREYQWKHLKNCFFLMKKFEQKNNFSYNYIIKSRSDHAHLVPLSNKIFNHLNDNNVCIRKRKIWGLPICDTFAIGKRKSMEIYCHTWDSIRTFRKPSPIRPGDEELIKNNIGCNFACNEKQLYRHLIKNNLVILDLNNYGNYVSILIREKSMDKLP